MAMGGIPFYLENIERGESPSQYIDRLCFTKEGILNDEFKNLYQSLFDKAEGHIKIVHALANKGKGLTRKEIIKECNFSTGGTVTKLLDELEESGFIIQYIPFGKTSRDTVYKIIDEYSLFYLKYIQGSRLTGKGIWEKLSQQPSWRSWSGIAFESICLKHIHQIKKALGISGVLTEESIWRYIPKTTSERGAQIDLLIDRADNCINLCEIKYSLDEYTITSVYKSALNEKKQVFRKQTGTRKSIFITMITTFGINPSAANASIVDKEVTMDKLFLD
jgi:predicted transcriptional regulator